MASDHLDQLKFDARRPQVRLGGVVAVSCAEQPTGARAVMNLTHEDHQHVTRVGEGVGQIRCCVNGGLELHVSGDPNSPYYVHPLDLWRAFEAGR